jgi:hypothetical protein
MAQAWFPLTRSCAFFGASAPQMMELLHEYVENRKTAFGLFEAEA